MSKGRVSFVALSARKGNLRGCVEEFHRAWSSSRSVRMSWKNVLANYLGGGEGFHLLRNCPRDVSAELLHHRTAAIQDFCGRLRDVTQVVAFISPSLLLIVFLLVLASLCSCFRQHRVKVRSFPAVFISLSYTLFIQQQYS